MKDSDIDEIFERAGAAHRIDPSLLGRVSTALTASLQPVRPIASAPVMALVLLAISVILAVAGAWWLGFYGVNKLNVSQMGSIFPALLIFVWLAALLSVAEMRPGGLRWKNPEVMDPVMRNRGMLLLVVMTIWLGLDAMVFNNYDLGAFISQGTGCLRAGLAIALPTGAASWMILRRGYAVDPAGAGIASGTLAGLAGLLMLELHCPNLRAPHVMVWHTAVIPASAFAGWLVGVGIRKSHASTSQYSIES